MVALCDFAYRHGVGEFNELCMLNLKPYKGYYTFKNTFGF